jgi:hypothetical protein
VTAQPFETVEQHFAPSQKRPYTAARLLAWLVGLGTVHLLLSVAYARALDRRHRVLVADAEVVASAAPLRLVVFGDSHPRNAVYDELLPSAANLANGGESLVKTWYRLQWILDRTERPIGAALIQLEPQAFDNWHADYFQPEYVYARYVPYLELGWKRGKLLEYGARWAKAHLAPYTGELRTVGEMWNRERDFRDDLEAERFSTSRSMDEWAQTRAEWHFLDHEVDDPLQLWALDQMLTRLEAEGIRPIFVSYPVSAEYRRAIERMGVVDRWTAALAPLLAKHPGIRWLDYHDVFYGRNDLFHDPDHVNRAGRQRFTRMLNDDLIALGVTPEESRILPRKLGPAPGVRAVDPPSR